MLCNNVSDYMHNTDLKNHLKHIHSHEIAADKYKQILQIIRYLDISQFP